MIGPRAIFDANLYLNFLLSPNPDITAVGYLFTLAAESQFSLCLPENVATELRSVIARRPYLAARVSQEVLDAQVRRILEFAVLLPLLHQEPARRSRDPNDDYLIALSILHEVDFIVTRDLLDLGEIAGIRIVDPVAFLALLRAARE